MAVILMLQNNEKAAMLVYQANPVEVQLIANVNTCSNKICMAAGHVSDYARSVKHVHTGLFFPLPVF